MCEGIEYVYRPAELFATYRASSLNILDSKTQSIKAANIVQRNGKLCLKLYLAMTLIMSLPAHDRAAGNNIRRRLQAKQQINARHT